MDDNEHPPGRAGKFQSFPTTRTHALTPNSVTRVQVASHSAEHAQQVTGPVEPKLFFANERTFLHWMHACVTLATVAMITTSAGGTSSPLLLASGTVLSLISVGLMIYAYKTFLWRGGHIRERLGGRTDDPIGPTILAGCILLAIAISLGVVLQRGRWMR